MSLKRHREMKLGIDEAADEKLGVALKTQHFKLHGMHESVKQAALGDFFVEDHNVEKGQRVHVRDFREIGKPQGPGFGVKRRIGEAFAIELDNPYLIEQGMRKNTAT